jgi:hypothetical protein
MVDMLRIVVDVSFDHVGLIYTLEHVQSLPAPVLNKLPTLDHRCMIASSGTFRANVLLTPTFGKPTLLKRVRGFVVYSSLLAGSQRLTHTSSSGEYPSHLSSP